VTDEVAVMSRKSQKRASAGVLAAGALAAGVGGLQYASSLDQPTPPEVSTIDVRLASTEFALPLDTNFQDLWLLGGGTGSRSLFGSEAIAPSGIFAASANGALVGRPLVGDGGLLIGDGLNAAANCQGSACNGGSGGLLFGNGGNGANGGRGGDAGLLFGNGTGGPGGNGDTADSIGGPVTGGNGGAGGRGGFGGNGGHGGDGKSATSYGGGTENQGRGGAGGRGGIGGSHGEPGSNAH
jgi:hypothetical protein